MSFLKTAIIALIILAGSFATAAEDSLNWQPDSQENISTQEATVNPYSFEIRLAPNAFYFNWLTVEVAYHINQWLDFGLNHTSYNANVDGPGNMFFPQFRGRSSGINSNFYFVDRKLYAGLKVNYEDFRSVGHNNPKLYANEGVSATGVFGVRFAPSSLKQRVALNLGAGLTKWFVKTREIDRTTGLSIDSDESPTWPYIEVKLGFLF